MSPAASEVNASELVPAYACAEDCALVQFAFTPQSPTPDSKPEFAAESLPASSASAAAFVSRPVVPANLFNTPCRAR